MSGKSCDGHTLLCLAPSVVGCYSQQGDKPQVPPLGWTRRRRGGTARVQPRWLMQPRAHCSALHRAATRWDFSGLPSRGSAPELSDGLRGALLAALRRMLQHPGPHGAPG